MLLQHIYVKHLKLGCESVCVRCIQAWGGAWRAVRVDGLPRGPLPPLLLLWSVGSLETSVSGPRPGLVRL